MLEWTDRHARYFLRGITKRTLLYTEMVTTGALVRGDAARHLDFDPSERPLALQLGGRDPADLAACAKMAEDWGYDEVNLNVGCPSDRVGAGAFGACLMAEPDVVARCVEAMRRATTLPITVKHRIGIDHQDSFEELTHFVRTVAGAGCKTFIVHARKAWLSGLSPKENREIPPLSYPTVHALKRDFPHLEIILNGGLRSLEAARVELERVDGVMIGRAAYETPYILAQSDRMIFGEASPIPTRLQVVEAFAPYVERRLSEGVALRHMTRHMLGLYHGERGARAWRRMLSDSSLLETKGAELLREAASCTGGETVRPCPEDMI